MSTHTFLPNHTKYCFMKKWMHKLFFLTLMAFAVQSCQKELSTENGASATGGTAEATLGGAPGNCANIQFKGIYGATLAVADTNSMSVELTFTKPGSYTITSDTCNGLYFKATGLATATGTATIALKAYGTPTTAGPCNFTVSFKGSTCTAVCNILPVATATTGDYFPTTVGSRWTYQSSDPSAGAGDTILTISTNSNATILATIFRLFTTENPAGKDSSFYRKNANDYNEYGDIDVAGVASNFVVGDYTFLKDNVAVNTEWETAEISATIGGTAAKMKLKYKLLAKDVDVVLDNKIYRNVIKVGNTSVAGPAGGPFTTVIAFEKWYAKGIGLINVAVAAPNFGYKVIKYQVN